MSPYNLNLMSTYNLLALKKIPEFRKDIGAGIPNCVVFETDSHCKYCSSEYYLHESKCKKVETRVDDCSIHLSATTCLRCLEGYLLKENKCLLITVSNCVTVQDENKCAKCSLSHPTLTLTQTCEAPSGFENCEEYNQKENNQWECSKSSDLSSATSGFSVHSGVASS